MNNWGNKYCFLNEMIYKYLVKPQSGILDLEYEMSMILMRSLYEKKIRGGKLCGWVLICGIVFTSSCSDSNTPVPLRIAAAANTQFVIDTLVSRFEAENNIACQVILGSSGKLTAQIQQGAPFDVFISADTLYPNTLYQKEMTVGKPQIFAFGKLVWWTMKNDIDPSPQSISKANKIAIANPKTAPYGKAAMAYLQDQSLYQEVKDKLVFGESIAQTNQFIASQTASLGLTAKSIVLSPTLKNKGRWADLPATAYPPIIQSVVVLPQPTNLAASKAFASFLQSPAAQALLLDYGYELP